jgi:hypothetical protein
VPDLDRAAEDQRGEQRVQGEAHEVGHDDHPVAGQAVGPHAADEQKGHEGHGVGCEDEADIRRAARRSRTAPARR